MKLLPLVCLGTTLLLASVRLYGIALPWWFILTPLCALALCWSWLGVYAAAHHRGYRRGQADVWAHVRHLIEKGILENTRTDPVVPKADTIQ
jgi:hypothetical protein